jgi:alkylated DNA repair dioxygenase AlkB
MLSSTIEKHVWTKGVPRVGKATQFLPVLAPPCRHMARAALWVSLMRADSSSSDASHIRSMIAYQHALFLQRAHVPEGFRHQEGFLSTDEERELTASFKSLPFREFEFRGFLGKRRTVSFGWRYDFNERELYAANQIPEFLTPVRQKAAEFAGLTEDRLQHALVTEYAPGAGIGWHRDRPEFEDVIGVSLGTPCVFRFRRKSATGWKRASIELQPRSAYLLRGAARWDWQHSIPPVDRMRYSITFRSLSESKNASSHRQR